MNPPLHPIHHRPMLETLRGDYPHRSLPMRATHSITNGIGMKFYFDLRGVRVAVGQGKLAVLLGKGGS